MTTYVYAETHVRAVHWCQENRLSQYNRSVRIISTPRSAEGLRYLPDDRVVIIGNVKPEITDSIRRNAAATRFPVDCIEWIV